MEFLIGRHLIDRNQDVELKKNVMVAKKTEKSDLENKKFLFFEIGLVLALALGLIALEWSSSESTNNWVGYTGDEIGEIFDIQITRPEKEKEIKKPKELPKIVIKDNFVEIDDVDYDFTSLVNWDDPIYFPELDPEEADDDSIHIFVGEMPKYRKGGLDKFHKHIQQIVEYPSMAAELGIQGKVYVQFVVDKKGYITGIQIQRGVDPLLDNAVIAAIEQSERWKPGKQMGIAVKVAMSMPVVFRLQ